MPALMSLNLSQCSGVTNERVRELSSMPTLMSLNLTYCNLTDVALRHLSSLRKLTYVLYNCRTTVAAEEELRRLILGSSSSTSEKEEILQELQGEGARALLKERRMIPLSSRQRRFTHSLTPSAAAPPLGLRRGTSWGGGRG
jgi:hypothetical protein